LPVHYSIVWLMMQMPAGGFPAMPSDNSKPVGRVANDVLR